MSADKDLYIRSTPLEMATGWVHGVLPASPLPVTDRTPRQALDDAMRPALLDAPCHVTFSGGRDSSAVLAAATDLARREGHQLPVPVTRVYPDLPDTDESKWQRQVIDHIGLTEWIRFEFTPEDTDLLGESARGAVRRRGPVWPPAMQTHGAMFTRLGGGSVMTGEGGDAVLGFRRATALTVLRNGRRPSRDLLRLATEALLPRRLRWRHVERDVRGAQQGRWLKPDAIIEHARVAARDETGEPLRYDQATWYIIRRRMFNALVHNCRIGAQEYGISSHEPLLDEGFVAALARAGGRWGFDGRTHTMRVLFSDVLPEAVLSRRSKASFNHAHTGSATNWFAESWDGTGVDTTLVDPERLREVWLSDSPTMATGMLLHAAWLTAGAPEP